MKKHFSKHVKVEEHLFQVLSNFVKKLLMLIMILVSGIFIHFISQMEITGRQTIQNYAKSE